MNALEQIPPEKPKKRRRAVYLLPNLFTTFGLLAGFYAIIVALEGNYVHAAIAIIVAMILDGVDGRVARMTNTQSEFGAQYDSLADMLSFGIAPALVMYQWALADLVQISVEMGRVGWLTAFFYTAMAALRLARFNANIGKVDKKYFVGLASPAAATLVVSFIWVCESLTVTGQQAWGWALLVTIFAGALMISPIFYSSFKTSFKDRDKEERIPFRGASVIVILLVLVVLNPPMVFFGGFLLYALSGPVFAIVRRIQKIKAKRIDLKMKSGKQNTLVAGESKTSIDK